MPRNTIIEYMSVSLGSRVQVMRISTLQHGVKTISCTLNSVKWRVTDAAPAEHRECDKLANGQACLVPQRGRQNSMTH
jgi:hypothetical protein